MNCDTASREYLGCGEPPAGYDVGTILAEASTPQEARATASQAYRFAAIGGVHEAYGALYPWCPRWFAELAPRAVAARAETIECASVRSVRGFRPWPLTAEGEEMVLRHLAHRDWIRAEAEEREAEVRAAKAGG